MNIIHFLRDFPNIKFEIALGRNLTPKTPKYGGLDRPLTSALCRHESKVAPVPESWPPGRPGHWACSFCSGRSSTVRTDPSLGSPGSGTALARQA